MKENILELINQGYTVYFDRENGKQIQVSANHTEKPNGFGFADNIEDAFNIAIAMIERRRREKIAFDLTKRISQMAKGYRVQWNPKEKSFPDDPNGMYEIIGTDGKVHYHRRNEQDVLSLAGLK